MRKSTTNKRRRKLATAKDLHKAERLATRWKSAAEVLIRVQITEFQAWHCHSWDDFPGNVFGHVTDEGRFIGVGFEADADAVLHKGERIARIQLPFAGGGFTMRNTVEEYLDKIDAQEKRARAAKKRAATIKKKKEAARKRGDLKVVRRAA